MEHSQSLSAIIALITLILILFTSIPHLLTVCKRARSKARGDSPDETFKLYEDEDGIATEEAQKKYSAAMPKYFALSCSLLGFSASTSIAVFSTVHPTLDLYVEHWLSFGIWVRMLFKRAVSTN